MKKWGSRVVDVMGYSMIGYTMSRYGLSGWDIFNLTLTILFIQWFAEFIKEVVEY